MKIALIQANYIPWIGYFSMINEVDKFIVYEDVQYTKNDYRNKNWILSSGEKIFLSIPVRHEFLGQNYMTIKVINGRWARKHFQTLRHHFHRSKNWKMIEPKLRECYEKSENLEYLYEINRLFLVQILNFLNIKTQLYFLDDFQQEATPSLRVAKIVKQFGGSSYLSGSAAKSYINENDFIDRDITIEWADYPRLIEKLKCIDEKKIAFENNYQTAIYNIATNMKENL
jgi:hypothetical protein